TDREPIPRFRNAKWCRSRLHALSSLVSTTWSEDMPTPTGLHTPVTNVPLAEANNAEELVSTGDLGFDDQLVLVAGAVVEPIPRVTLESALEFAAPSTEGLPDIGVASFGPAPQIESVIGTDERVQITDTTKLPWRLSASLLITAADNSQWMGTGWFISPRTL